jgi:replicative DNA helicase
MAEIIIAKHRNGAVGSILLNFKGHFARFQNRNEDQFIPLPGEELGASFMQNSPEDAVPPADLPIIPPSGDVPF